MVMDRDHGMAEVEKARSRAFAVTPFTVIATAVILLLAVSQFLVAGDFFSKASLATLTPLIGIMAIISIGQAFVIGTGGIDLSVPATVTLMGVIVVKASEGSDGGLAGAIGLCLLACILIGLMNGVLVEGLGLSALVATLATGQLIAGATLLYRGPSVLAVAEVPPRLESWTGANLAGLSYILLVGVLVAALGGAFLRRGVSGRRLVAASASRRAAFLVGLRAGWYRILAYVIASTIYGLGGILAAGQVGTPDLTLGEPYLLSSIVAVVLGGAVLTGGRVSPVATLLGAVFITVLDHDLQVEGYSPGVQLIVQGVVLAGGLALVFAIKNRHRIRRALRHERGVVLTHTGAN